MSSRRAAIGALLVLAGAAAPAAAANLVNMSKGRCIGNIPCADVPTFEGRIWYVKPAGTTCPPGVRCFCDSGSYCTLPGTGIITGTIVIDRPGVTMDCQNRIIQPPRYADSTQVCGGAKGCGFNADIEEHPCVNGYCQLKHLAGINVGGPLHVNDAPISIDVPATGFVQSVIINNCVVRNFDVGVGVEGSNGDNGLDHIAVRNSELRSCTRGVSVISLDGTLVAGNSIHDNSTGIYAKYDWGFEVFNNTVENNATQLYSYPLVQTLPLKSPTVIGYNRWFDLAGNTFRQANPHARTAAVRINNVEASLDSATKCNGTSRCDLRIANNIISSTDSGAVVIDDLVSFSSGRPRTQVSFNTFSVPESFSHVAVYTSEDPIRTCWTGNTCNTAGVAGACREPEMFTPTTCGF